MQDIFLSYNMFFILDESKPDVIRNENYNMSYPVLDTIKPSD